MNPLPDQELESAQRPRLLAKAISRWDNEGGAGDGGHLLPASEEVLADALPLTNAELVQLQIRVIALENLLAVLLVDASEQQLKLARDVADCISPRPGFTPHRLTIHAAARMIGLIERSGHLRDLHAAARPLCHGAGATSPTTMKTIHGSPNLDARRR